MAESLFWKVTDDNHVIFPDWQNLTFTEFWYNYLLDEHKKTIICAGRGSGKSYNCVFKEIYIAFREYIKKKTSGAKRRIGAQYHLIIIAPTKESFAPIIQYLDDMVPQIPGYSPDGVLNFRKRNSNGKSDYRLFGDGELVITVYSAYNAEILRGKSADSVLLDEAFLIPRDAVESVIIPIVNRQGGYLGRFTLAGTPDTEKLIEPWFDRAADEADEAVTDRFGYFSKFHLYTASWLVNPFISEELLADIQEERLLNETKYLRERMAIRGLVVQEAIDGSGEVFNQDMLNCCFYREKPTVQSTRDLLIGIDTAYGGRDALVRVIFCKRTNRFIDITIVDAKDFTKEEDGVKTVRQFILDTAKAYPGAQIIYDKSGRLGSSLPSLLPTNLRLTPVDRGNVHKNRNVETMLARMLELNDNGQCEAIQFPDLDSGWLTQRQHDCFKRLYTEMVNYHEEKKIDKFGKETGRRYTKKPPFTDDCIDACTILMDFVNPLRREKKVNVKSVIKSLRRF